MKILHICVTGPYTDDWNYQENLLTKYQAKAGSHVSILASQWAWKEDGKIEKIVQTCYRNKAGVTVYRLPIKGDRDVFYRYKRFDGFLETIEFISPDIIFIHNLQFFDIDKIIEYAKLYIVRIYADNHADFTNSARSVAAKIFYKTVWRYYAKKLEPFVAKFYGVLPIRLDFLKDIYGLSTEKLELLVMGADDDKIFEAKEGRAREVIRSKYGIKPDEFLVMTGGKIDEWKTQTLLLMQAVGKIQNEKIKLIVFGSAIPELIQKVNELSDGKKVQYIGWIASDLSYNYWSAADLAVFPGRHSVFWEQVAGMGIPMICKYWEGTTHVDVGGNVIFLKQDSVEEIQSILQYLLTNPGEYQKMLDVACGKGKEKFSYKEISRKAIQME